MPFIPNSQVVQAPRFSGARVGLSTDAVFAGSGNFAWDTELWDTDGYHSNTVNNSRFTIPVNGIYRVAFGMRQSSAATTFISIYVNVESDPAFQVYSVSNTPCVSGLFSRSLSAGDYIYMSCGGASTWKAGGGGYPPAFFEIERLAIT